MIFSLMNSLSFEILSDTATRMAASRPPGSRTGSRRRGSCPRTRGWRGCRPGPGSCSPGSEPPGTARPSARSPPQCPGSSQSQFPSSPRNPTNKFNNTYVLQIFFNAQIYISPWSCWSPAVRCHVVSAVFPEREDTRNNVIISTNI